MTVLERLATAFLRVHNAVYRKTGGRIGRRIPGFAPALLLHTVGARTGLPRTTSLSYSHDGGDYLVVASKGGHPRPPDWYVNLTKRPDTEINVGPRRFPVTAHSVAPGDPDHERLWDIVNRNNRNVYRGYQARTRRPIPVVVLTPR